MSAVKQTITDSEYQIMRILWESEKRMTVAEVVSALDENSWTASTVSTFLQRLLKKEVIACEKKGKTNLYYPKLAQSEYDLNETENFLSKLYKGSVKNLVAALYENKKLSNEELTDLKKMFELE
ncbi:MAG: BlaI/MecI/CopY family transcriptional regulator [Clostridia bacterium]|nr:BlaI/MecI/CopY family transcriptional regulator [Clostridia bacterium]MBQ3553561.1 BlaI/MecI/CopY family transcriptional regulator [Clostridia bacterium]